MNSDKKLKFDNIIPKKINTDEISEVLIHHEVDIINNFGIEQKIQLARKKLLVLSAGFLSTIFLTVSIIFTYSNKDLVLIEKTKSHFDVSRGKILDRNEKIISASIPSKDLYLDPRKIIKKEKIFSELKLVFPSISKKKLKKIIDRNRYTLLKKQITKADEISILKIGEPGLIFETSEKRIYPQKNIFSQITGFLSNHNIAQSKLEKNYDVLLSKGKDLKLTLDLKVQNIVHEEIKEGMYRYKAKSAAGIVMNVNNGEILSIVSLPDYDPNQPKKIKPFSENNLITSARYEMGSTLKTFNIAMAIMSNPEIKDMLFDVSEPYEISKNFTVKDIEKFNEPIDINTILSQSSNIGSIKIFNYVGLDKQKEFFRIIGLKSHTEINGLNTIQNRFPDYWNDSLGKSLSFGYGASITPISLASTFATLVNGGFKVFPTIVKQDIPKKKRLIKKKISDEICKLLSDVVEFGSGKMASVKYLKIGGKTSTAEKNFSGKYTDKLVTSFIGVYPINKPKYLTFVLFDEPKVFKKDVKVYGGNTAAPVFSKIVSRISPILKIWPNQKNKNPDEQMVQN